MRLAPDNYLLDHLGAGFDLLYFTDGEAVPDALRAVAHSVRQQGIGMRIVAITSAPQALEVPGADLSLADSTGRCRARYGVQAAGAAYLLRPDQHVCARWVSLDAGRLASALRCALQQGQAQSSAQSQAVLRQGDKA